MKQLLTFLLLITLSASQAAGNYLLVAGSGTKNISIFEKNKHDVVWSHALEPGQECNSVCMNKKGQIVYSYKQGARLIDLNHQTIWDYKAPENTELQLATSLKDGSYLLGICGTPARIIELDKDGNKKVEITVDLQIKNPHQQFRTISKLKNGNYLIPLFSQGYLIEIDANGKELKKYDSEAGSFAALELNNGDFMVSGGDSHAIRIVSRKEAKVIGVIKEKDIPGVSLLFVAQIIPLKSHHFLVCNWQGHVQNPSVDEPQMAEFDLKRSVFWTMNNKKQFDKISSCCDVSANKYFKRYLKKLKP